MRGQARAIGIFSFSGSIVTISQPRSLLLSLTLVLGACGGEGLTLPPDGAAAHIEVLWGDNQSARVGERLPDSVVVRVTDTQNRPVSGVDVVFDFTAGGSTASPAAATDSDGATWSRLVLGTVPGPVNGQAKVPVAAGITPVETPITATARPADANGIALISGDTQTGAVGTELLAPLVVAVTDRFGNPIPGITVQWSVTDGGSVSSNSTITDASGQTSVTRTLGPASGPQITQANSFGLAGTPVTFNHTATAGSAARVIVVDGNGQHAPAGSKLGKALAIRVLDAENNPIPGQPVSWVVGAGDGSASPENGTTDVNGEARTEWTLGPNPGPNTLTAVANVGRASFNATGDKLASTTRITSHSEPSMVGTPVSVGVTVDGTGGTPSGQVTVSGDGALASCTITLANGSGSCSITFAQPGNRDLTATYAGDSRFSGSSVTVKHQVSPAPVPNNAPTADFRFSCTDLDCVFTDESTDGDGNVVGWTWDFGDPGSGGQNGSTSQSPSHRFSAANTYTVTLTARDDDGATDPHSEQVTVEAAPPVNQAPVANDDPSASSAPYTTSGAGAPLTVSASDGVLQNDTDPNNDALTALNASTPPKGSVVLNPNGSFTYTPNLGAAGTDTFTYQANDGQLSSTAATVTINITP